MNDEEVRGYVSRDTDTHKKLWKTLQTYLPARQGIVPEAHTIL